MVSTLAVACSGTHSPTRYNRDPTPSTGGAEMTTDALAKLRSVGPWLGVEQAGVRAGDSQGQWFAAWRVENRSLGPVLLLNGWLPHAQFRGEEQAFDGQGTLAPGEKTSVELAVRCQEPPGTEFSNGFLIMQVTWKEEPWRVLARLRVVVGDDGTPSQEVVAVTTQPIGFSG